MTDLSAYVSMPHATFSLILRDGYVIDAPPISHRSVGQRANRVLTYYRVSRRADVRVSPLGFRWPGGCSPGQGSRG